MKHITIQTYCDWPGCAEAWMKEHGGEEQETRLMDFNLTPVSQRGRKQGPARVLLCPEHLQEMYDLRDALSENKQFEELIR